MGSSSDQLANLPQRRATLGSPAEQLVKEMTRLSMREQLGLLDAEPTECFGLGWTRRTGPAIFQTRELEEVEHSRGVAAVERVDDDRLEIGYHSLAFQDFSAQTILSILFLDLLERQLDRLGHTEFWIRLLKFARAIGLPVAERRVEHMGGVNQTMETAVPDEVQDQTVALAGMQT